MEWRWRTCAHVAHALLVEQLAGGLVCKITQELAKDVGYLALDGLLLHPDARWPCLSVQVQPNLRLHTYMHPPVTGLRSDIMRV